MIYPSLFAIVVGVGMIGMWTMSYVSKQIPELKSEPIRIKFHFAAEFTTSIALLIGGVSLLTSKPWAVPAYLIGMGMLFYTVIVSPGYFAQKGQSAYVGMFAAILILAIVSLLAVV